MSDTKPTTEKSIFLPSIILAAILAVGFVFFSEATSGFANAAMSWITTYFGWLYLLSGMGAIIFCLWLSLGRFGHVKLGDADEKPEFSGLHWVAMMFTAGIGAGLMTWAFVEPIYYLQTPPFGIEPHSSAAFEWAHMYPVFHWGLIPWAFYALPTVPIAYPLYVKKDKFLRVSAACDQALPHSGKSGAKTLIDIFIILGLLGGTATSLGLGVPLVSALTAELFGITDSQLVKFSVLGLWVLLFGASTLRGLKKGIQVLADINMVLAGVVLAFIFIAGPTLFILNMSVNSIGLMLDNMIRMSFWSDPIEKTGFVQDWTVFYWAWWLAYATLMGLFVGRISRGRTIKQVIMGTLLWGSLGTSLFLLVAGGYALDLQLNNIQDLSATLTTQGMSAVTADAVAALPFGKLVLTVFIILCLIFYATTMDSAAFVLAGVCSKDLPSHQDPQLSLRISWILIVGLFTAGMIISGNLNTVKSLTVISSLPLIPILTIMCVSLIKELKLSHGDIN